MGHPDQLLRIVLIFRLFFLLEFHNQVLQVCLLLPLQLLHLRALQFQTNPELIRQFLIIMLLEERVRDQFLPA